MQNATFPLDFYYLDSGGLITFMLSGEFSKSNPRAFLYAVSESLCNLYDCEFVETYAMFVHPDFLYLIRDTEYSNIPLTERILAFNEILSLKYNDHLVKNAVVFVRVGFEPEKPWDVGEPGGLEKYGADLKKYGSELEKYGSELEKYSLNLKSIA